MKHFYDCEFCGKKDIPLRVSCPCQQPDGEPEFRFNGCERCHDIQKALKEEREAIIDLIEKSLPFTLGNYQALKERIRKRNG